MKQTAPRRQRIGSFFGIWLLSIVLSVPAQVVLGNHVISNWQIRAAGNAGSGGPEISRVNYDAGEWYRAKDASTVLAALVANGVYPDPYYGTNLATIPGYRPGSWQTLDMPEDSPFNVHWWYRSEFEIPAEYVGKHIYLSLHGINYKANVWMNGRSVADSTGVEGPYRSFELDVTPYAVPGEQNAVALEIVPPRGRDLSIRWMQGTRTPPDKDTGIWYDVRLSTGGPVHLEKPHVITDLNLPSADTATLTISGTVRNKTARTVRGVLYGTISPVNNVQQGGNSEGGSGKITYSQDIRLTKGQSLRLTKQLEIVDPQLWWPVDVGRQNLYDLILEIRTEAGTLSERDTVRFGIREVSAGLETHNGRRVMVYRINGKRILIRGGDWTETMMMETSSAREEAAIRYAKNMHLNTLRLESFWGSNHFFELADKYGILIFNGLNCCSIWERWAQWTEHTADVAVASLRDQVIRLRNHPCIMSWDLGSDRYPPLEIERRYIDVVHTYDPGTPYIPAMTGRTSNIYGYTGESSRPRRHAYPYQWYRMEGFNWESGGVGAEQIPPIESMRTMMPAYDLWPISGSWNIRLWQAGTTYYPESRQAFYDRYGKPGDLESYCVTSQPWQYESNRAVYEATARRKYVTSGNLKYRFNTGWPALCFQFYDYYLRPNGAFFGAQKACEPLHVQYAYDDHAIYVVNSYYRSFDKLRVTATLLNFGMTEQYHKTAVLGIGPDGVKQAFPLPAIGDLSDTYFLSLKMADEKGKQVSRNFYWLSASGDSLADFRHLDALPTVDLQVQPRLVPSGRNYQAEIAVKNPSDALAFFINPTIIKGLHGTEVLPVYWETNDFSLLPHDSITVTAVFDRSLLDGKEPHLMLEGWNIQPAEYSLNGSHREVTPPLMYSGFFAPARIGADRRFEVSITVTNGGKTGEGILKTRQYLYIDGHPQGYRRIALAPGERTKLMWPYVRISNPGKHTVTIGSHPAVPVMVEKADHFWPIQESK